MQTNTAYQGHRGDGSSIQNHSVGGLYPYYVRITTIGGVEYVDGVSKEGWPVIRHFYGATREEHLEAITAVQDYLFDLVDKGAHYG